MKEFILCGEKKSSKACQISTILTKMSIEMRQMISSMGTKEPSILFAMFCSLGSCTPSAVLLPSCPDGGEVYIYEDGMSQRYVMKAISKKQMLIEYDPPPDEPSLHDDEHLVEFTFSASRVKFGGYFELETDEYQSGTPTGTEQCRRDENLPHAQFPIFNCAIRGGPDFNIEYDPKRGVVSFWQEGAENEMARLRSEIGIGRFCQPND